MAPPTPTFAERFNELCRRRGWSYRAAAERYDVSHDTIGRLRRGQILPDLGLACRIADDCGVTLGWLAGRDEGPDGRLGDDERLVLRVVRALGIDGDEAVRRLSGAGPTDGYPMDAPGGPDRPGRARRSG